MPKDIESYNWSEWRKFPDPRKGEYLTAPFGCGVYQLRNHETDEFILFGLGKNCAYRMSSLLPKPHGQGTRNNESKRIYLLENISNVQYRTSAYENELEMKAEEEEIKNLRIHLFNT
jgi:hypothetical protein